MARQHAEEGRAGRRWHIPPPLIVNRSGLPGIAVLEEFDNELGTLLWQSLRTAWRWADAPRHVRGKLFLAGAYERRIADVEGVASDLAITEPLCSVAGLLRGAADAREEEIGLACARIARWADDQGARATAFEFRQAAALSSPADPELALGVARAARDRAEYAVADAWYQRTIALGRRAGDWDTYARSYIGIGKSASARGAYPAARKAFLKAFRVASRRSLHEPLGMALHDLLVVETESGRFEAALQYAPAALQAYGPGHHLLPTLAHDVAYVWMQLGRFADALPVIEAAVEHMIPEHRPSGYGNLARAAGALGDDRTFRDAWTAVWSADDHLPDTPDALLEAARGAATLGRWGDAERAAARALEMGSSRARGKLTFDAEAVLGWIRSERGAGRARAAPPARVASREPADALAQDFVRVLKASAPTGESWPWGGNLSHSIQAARAARPRV